MQIDESFTPDAHIVRSYKDRQIEVALPGGQPSMRANGQQIHIRETRCFERSIIITPAQVIEDVLPSNALELSVEHIDILNEQNPELVIIGTGDQISFPDQKITMALWQKGIGVEIMDTAAACRTYNFLMSDGRKVIAALFID